MKGKKHRIRWFSAAALAGTAALYQGLVTRKYALFSDKLHPGRSLRFVVLADLHNTLHGEGQRQLLDRVRRSGPDYILLPGDLFDDCAAQEHTLTFLEKIPKIAPAYCVPGNHEHRTRRLEEIVALAEEQGVTVLRDRAVRLGTAAGPVVLAGCEDVVRSLYQDPAYDQVDVLRRAFDWIDGCDAYTVLLAHRPERILLYRMLGFDLVVSGHAHGGQIRIPYLLNGFYAPGQGMFPPYAGGCYHYDSGTVHAVTRGLSAYPCLPRVCNPPEITVLQVAGKPAARPGGNHR